MHLPNQNVPHNNQQHKRNQNSDADLGQHLQSIWKPIDYPNNFFDVAAFNDGIYLAKESVKLGGEGIEAFKDFGRDDDALLHVYHRK